VLAPPDVQSCLLLGLKVPCLEVQQAVQPMHLSSSWVQAAWLQHPHARLLASLSPAAFAEPVSACCCAAPYLRTFDFHRADQTLVGQHN
jgi:hypothetical protein